MRAARVVPLYCVLILEAFLLVEGVATVAIAATIAMIGTTLAAIAISISMLPIIAGMMLLLVICLSSFVDLRFVR